MKEFVELCGFIPNSDFNINTRSFTRLLTSTNYIPVIKKLCELGGSKYVIEKMGSWIQALYESSVIKEKVIKNGIGYRCISEDGHECNSLAELRIDNYLYKNGIEHEKEPHYPKHDIYNKRGLKRADWLLGNGTYVEYFGLEGDENYDKKTEQKLNLIADLEIPSISLFPSDLFNLEKILKK